MTTKTPREVIRQGLIDAVPLAWNDAFVPADAILSAFTAAGYVIVPREPTKAMLVNSGAMNGYDPDSRTADADHIAWWRAMIAEAEKETERLTATLGGYKGGSYTMNRHTPIHVDNWGECSGTGVVGVRGNDWRTVLITATVDD